MRKIDIEKFSTDFFQTPFLFWTLLYLVSHKTHHQILHNSADDFHQSYQCFLKWGPIAPCWQAANVLNGDMES